METLAWDTPMLVSALILAATFSGIFTEGLHHIHRTKIAMLGAATMVFSGQIFGFYGPEDALEAIDWNVVFLLGAMMVIIAIMIPTGGFQAIAFWIARVSGGRQFVLLAMLGTAVTLLSLLLDNVTTVVIFGPLIVLICEVLKVSPIPYLLAAALLTDTGGVATLVGDPPNLMIGSAADIDFNTFFLRMGGVVFAAWLATLVALRFLFWKELSVKPETVRFAQDVRLEDPKTWKLSLAVLGLMVVLFVFHRELHWEAWVVASVGMLTLFLIGRHLHMDPYLEKVEYALLIFFISLFVMVGGVEHSRFLQFLGQHIMPFVQDNLSGGEPDAALGLRDSLRGHRQHPVHGGDDPDHPQHGGPGHERHPPVVVPFHGRRYGRQWHAYRLDRQCLHRDTLGAPGSEGAQPGARHYPGPVVPQGDPCHAGHAGGMHPCRRVVLRLLFCPDPREMKVSRGRLRMFGWICRSALK